MGLSYSPLRNGAFGLLLAVEGDSPIRIPVVIGAPEAQSIAILLERVASPRPMTHDLFCSFAHAFGVRLREVFIYKFEDGIYSAEMTFSDGERTVVLDARTSDAVAVAMRTGAPIYTTQAIVDECGIELEEIHNDDTDTDEYRMHRPGADDNDDELDSDSDITDDVDVESDEDDDVDDGREHKAADKSFDIDEILRGEMSPRHEALLTNRQLEKRMAFLAEQDDYEGAMRVKALLDKRLNHQDED